jgi:hypothetical protein
MENLVTGLPSNSKFPAKFRHRLAGDPQIAVSHPLPNIPSNASLPLQKGEKCTVRSVTHVSGRSSSLIKRLRQPPVRPFWVQ